MTWVKEFLFYIGQIKELRITNASIYLTYQRITSYDETIPTFRPEQHRSVVGDVERNWQLSALHRGSYN